MGDPNRYKPRHSWYLSDAQTLVRQLQQVMWPLEWHVAMGGSVLTHGYSDKDLDIYILPMKAGVTPDGKVAEALTSVLGSSCAIGSETFHSQPHPWCYYAALKFELQSSQRIDVFIVRNGA